MPRQAMYNKMPTQVFAEAILLSWRHIDTRGSGISSLGH